MMEVVSKEILNLSLFLQQKIDLVKVSETVRETINYLQSIMGESDTIATRRLRTTAKRGIKFSETMWVLWSNNFSSVSGLCLLVLPRLLI